MHFGAVVVASVLVEECEVELLIEECEVELAVRQWQALVAEFHQPPQGLDANEGRGRGVGEVSLAQNCSEGCAMKAE